MLNHVNFLDEIVIMFFPCTFICDILFRISMQKDKRFLFIILVEKSGKFKKLKFLDSFNIYFQYRTNNSNALNSLYLHIISVLRMV